MGSHSTRNSWNIHITHRHKTLTKNINALTLETLALYLQPKRKISVFKRGHRMSLAFREQIEFSFDHVLENELA